jgi:hypothetical protein
MAHLLVRGHTAAFWELTRRLVDAAADAGLYNRDAEPELCDIARGDIKLARSAAAGRTRVAVALRKCNAMWRIFSTREDTPEARAAAGELVTGESDVGESARWPKRVFKYIQVRNWPL